MDSDLRLFPEQASSIASSIDGLYFFLTAISAFFTILIAGLIVFFAIKYRKGSRADRTPPATPFYSLEIIWMVIPFLLTMVMFGWGARLYFQLARPPAGAIEIQVVAKQWMWKFQHPEGNAEINELHVPLGKPVRLRMISEDVIHSMFIPAFRTKHDVLPGRYTSLWFEASKLGEYHLFCAEYCGAKHSEMRGRVVVQEPSKYQAWLAGATAGESPVESGRKLFEQLRCGSCHQGGGSASRGPPLENLVGAAVKLQGGQTTIANDDYLRESIVRPAAKVVMGYQPIMPTFEGQIGEEGLLQLLAYLKSLSKQPPPSEAQP